MSSTHDVWRYRCPNGHVSWHHRTRKRANSEYYCETCQQNGANPHFGKLRDMKDE